MLLAAPAHAGISLGGNLAAVLRPADVECALAVDAAVGVRAEEVALALDQRRRAAGAAVAVVVGEARGEQSLAAIIADHYWDWGEVERHYERAIALDPNDVTTLRFYSFYLAYTGRPVEAMPIAEEACRLDPVSPNARMNLGVTLLMAGRVDDAVRQFEETLELDSNFSLAHVMLGLAYAA